MILSILSNHNTGTNGKIIITTAATTITVGLLLLAFAITLLLYVLIKRKKINDADCRQKFSDSDLSSYRRMNTDTAGSIEHITGCEIKNKHYIHTNTKKGKYLFPFPRKYENLQLQELGRFQQRTAQVHELSSDEV